MKPSYLIGLIGISFFISLISPLSISAADTATRNVIIILDASNSMEDPIGGATKWEQAKKALYETLQKIPPEVRVGLRVYGHKYFKSGASGFLGIFDNGQDDMRNCQQSELMVPLSSGNRDNIYRQLDLLQPTGRTPISYSIRQSVANDFTGATGKRSIILISDGRETCANVDPCTETVKMVRSGTINNVKINVVGYGLQDPVAESQLKCVALSTKARYYSADTYAKLAKSLQDSMKTQYSVKARVVPSD
jgi:Ca-activated chloride channel family protein